MLIESFGTSTSSPLPFRLHRSSPSSGSASFNALRLIHGHEKEERCMALSLRHRPKGLLVSTFTPKTTLKARRLSFLFPPEVCRQIPTFASRRHIC